MLTRFLLPARGVSHPVTCLIVRFAWRRYALDFGVVQYGATRCASYVALRATFERPACAPARCSVVGRG
eukprot:2360121-Lingulodinium_polyedra.AAC.1